MKRKIFKLLIILITWTTFNSFAEEQKKIDELTFSNAEINSVLKCPFTIEELVIKGIEEKPALVEQLLSILTANKDDHQNQIP